MMPDGTMLTSLTFVDIHKIIEEKRGIIEQKESCGRKRIIRE